MVTGKRERTMDTDIEEHDNEQKLVQITPDHFFCNDFSEKAGVKLLPFFQHTKIQHSNSFTGIVCNYCCLLQF